MKQLTKRELIDMVVAQVPDPESRIQKMFEWHFQKEMELIKVALGVAVSFLVTILVAFAKDEWKLPWYGTIIALIGALGPAGFAMFWLRRLRLIHRQFVDALKLYREWEKVSTFLIKVKEEAQRVG